MSKLTKRVHVSFDMTVVVDTTDFHKDVVKELAQRCGRGEKLEPMQENILVAALTHGEEAAVEVVLKQGLRSAVKEMVMEASCKEMILKMAPVRVDIRK